MATLCTMIGLPPRLSLIKHLQQSTTNQPEPVGCCDLLDYSARFTEASGTICKAGLLERHRHDSGMKTNWASTMTQEVLTCACSFSDKFHSAAAEHWDWQLHQLHQQAGRSASEVFIRCVSFAVHACRGDQPEAARPAVKLVPGYSCLHESPCCIQKWQPS